MSRRLTRFAMYKELKRVTGAHVVEPLGWPEESVLSLGSSAALCTQLGIPSASLVDTRYPDVDMLALPYESDRFAAVLSDQVLEHVAGDPFQAVRESCRVLRPGGLLVHTTCFVNPLHQLPHDYWRFSPKALQLLLPDEMHCVSADGWGSRAAVVALASGLRGLRVRDSAPRWDLRRLLAERAHPSWPIVTWVVATKGDPASLDALDSAR